ncbi:hypothetical protein JDV02_009002 [Purpureocillium takamizusanense]|uniref:Uncharacterized protein n=1 Tax=Purpureocillium takamizusanense TaxID=2060973 RepID=A0A9Q8QRI5_9HYPO|nr:uncharacterized protein JDV02_009002 [Purpureocillium takamizusanense]UNI23167.1 hypothetical protein JDV02_009002 [Purpureocillium takamizusanense]
MRRSILAVLAAASTACAQYKMLLPGFGGQGDISPRAFGDGICTLGSTCEQCFGEGYIICARIGCFNPDKGQQCCNAASLCVGKTNACCKDWGGPGETGKAGAPASPTRSTISPTGSGVFQCTKADSGEGCCQKAHKDMHWCSGAFPYYRCYNAKNQWCCTDGTVCDEENCCKDLFSLSTTQPWKAKATQTDSKTADSSITSAPDTTAAATTSGGGGAGAQATSSSKAVGAVMGPADLGFAGVLGSLLGAVLLL